MDREHVSRISSDLLRRFAIRNTQPSNEAVDSFVADKDIFDDLHERVARGSTRLSCIVDRPYARVGLVPETPRGACDDALVRLYLFQTEDDEQQDVCLEVFTSDEWSNRSSPEPIFNRARDFDIAVVHSMERENEISRRTETQKSYIVFDRDGIFSEKNNEQQHRGECPPSLMKLLCLATRSEKARKLFARKNWY